MGKVQQEQRRGVARLVVRSKSDCDVCPLSSWKIRHPPAEVRREQPDQQRCLRHVRPLEQDQQGLHRQVGITPATLPSTHHIALQDQRMPGRAQKPQVEPDLDEECK